MYKAIEGVACLGKSTIIRRLQEEGYFAHLTDYGDFIKMTKDANFPTLELKDVQLAYTIWYAKTAAKSGNIYDRSIVSPMLYSLVHGNHSDQYISG